MSRIAASVVENDWAGQNTLHEGERVFLKLGEKFEVDHIWPFGSYYVPAKCPQCKQPPIITYWVNVNSDGVCFTCRPPQTCYRCNEEFDPKFLHEEQGELVCSTEATVNVRIVVVS